MGDQVADGIQCRQVLCHACNSLQTPQKHQDTLHNQTITPVKHSTYLGVTLSDDLTWRTHIPNVVVDVSRTLNFLRRTLRIASQSTKALAYKALVRPKLEYAPSVWDPHHAKLRNALEEYRAEPHDLPHADGTIPAVSRL